MKVLILMASLLFFHAIPVYASDTALNKIEPIVEVRSSTPTPIPYPISDQNTRHLCIQTVQEYVRDNLDEEDRLFHLWDEVLEMDRALELLSLGPDVYALGLDRYMTHAKFFQKSFSQSSKDEFLDVDFTIFIRDDEWYVNEIKLHQVNGQPRFLYDSQHHRIIPNEK